MIVKALITFNDYQEEVKRKTGELFIVSEKRYNEILKKGGPWVEEANEDDLQKLKRTELEKIALGIKLDKEKVEKAKNKGELIELIKGEA